MLTVHFILAKRDSMSDKVKTHVKLFSVASSLCDSA